MEVVENDNEISSIKPCISKNKTPSKAFYLIYESSHLFIITSKNE